MSKFLFVNHASVGHLSTLLNIGVALKEAGHEVRFAMPGAEGLPRLQIFSVAAAVPAMVKAEGMAVELMSPSFSFLVGAARLPGKTGYDETYHAVGLSTLGLEHFAKQLLSSIERDRPDVIVTDFAFLASSVAADAAGIPYAAVWHSGLPFRGPEIPPFGSGLPIGPLSSEWESYEEREGRLLHRMDERVNATRRRHGLPEVQGGFLRRPYSPWLNLVMTVPEIEAPRDSLGEHTHFVGPCFGRGKLIADEFPFEELREDKVKIYVSLGTVFNNKPEIFRVLMDGLDDPAWQVVISAGKAYETLRAEGVPPNVILRPRVPQVALLPKMDLVIGHGGNNSTNETLAAGKPLIVLPVGGEQGDNASRVEWLGVGRRLSLRDLGKEDVRLSVTGILEDSSIPARSRALQEAIAQAGGIREAVDFLVAMTDFVESSVAER